MNHMVHDADIRTLSGGPLGPPVRISALNTQTHLKIKTDNGTMDPLIYQKRHVFTKPRERDKLLLARLLN